MTRALDIIVIIASHDILIILALIKAADAIYLMAYFYFAFACLRKIVIVYNYFIVAYFEREGI